jgi:hypothetical protein
MLLSITRSADSYGLVLILILLDYVAISALAGTLGGSLIIALLLGFTLMLSLRTSRAHGLLVVLAWAYLLTSTLAVIIGARAPGGTYAVILVPFVGGFLLMCAPVVIIRRVAAHAVVSVETILGAIDVYLLFGMIFALLFKGLGDLGHAAFFTGVSHATVNDYLFFSYSTLTTVGYGNLVPAGNVGQTLAMVEALLGQIYLVIIVARLVSLWGQVRPKTPEHPTDAGSV